MMWCLLRCGLLRGDEIGLLVGLAHKPAASEFALAWLVFFAGGIGSRSIGGLFLWRNRLWRPGFTLNNGRGLRRSKGWNCGRFKYIQRVWRLDFLG